MPTENATMFDQVAEVIERLRPFYYATAVTVHLLMSKMVLLNYNYGACGTCPSSTITLKAGIERALHEEVPGVIEVEQVF